MVCAFTFICYFFLLHLNVPSSRQILFVGGCYLFSLRLPFVIADDPSVKGWAEVVEISDVIKKPHMMAGILIQRSGTNLYNKYP